MNIRDRFLHGLLSIVSKVLPENRISFEGDVYLRRFYICGKMPDALKGYFTHGPKPREIAGHLDHTYYLHCFMRPDKDRDLHNHPWPAKAWILIGGYVEERYTEHPSNPDARRVTREYFVGETNTLRADTFHRVHVLNNVPTWTVLRVGEKCQSWGFWLEDEGRFVNHRDYANASDPEKRRYHEPKGAS